MDRGVDRGEVELEELLLATAAEAITDIKFEPLLELDKVEVADEVELLVDGDTDGAGVLPYPSGLEGVGCVGCGVELGSERGLGELLPVGS